MKTELRPKTFAIPHQLILRGFILIIAAFTALDALCSTNTMQVAITVRFVELQPNSDWFEKLDWYALASLTNRPHLFTANLTDAQLKTALQKIDRREGADLINEEQVTTLNGKEAEFVLSEGLLATLSGKRAQFRVVDVQTVADNSAGITNLGVSTKFDPKTDPFGTTLDLVPSVSDDGSTIQIVLIPTTTEFLGNNQPGAFALSLITNTAGGVPIMGPLPLPHTRVRQVTLSHGVKDGQTLVLGGLSGKANGIMGTNLLMFVTPTLIDSFGHRIHNSGEYYDDRLY